jgi:putative transposase
MSSYQSSGHCVGESNWHFQFTPAYRRKIFADQLIRELTTAYLFEAAQALGIHVAALNFGPDHVHLFLEQTRKVSVVAAVQKLKGFSSYMMRKLHKDLFQQMLWGDKFWSGGYFYQTVGQITADSVKEYIEKSQQKHWKEYIEKKQTTLLCYAA